MLASRLVIVPTSLTEQLMTPTRLAISLCLLAGLFSHAEAIEFEQTGRYVAPPLRAFLGAPVGVGGGFAVVGQPDEIYVLDAAQGTYLQTLAPASFAPTPPTGLTGAVAMDGSIALIPTTDETAILYDIATSSVVRTLVPTTPVPAGVTFGSRVAIKDGIALVSATPNSLGGSRRVYAFDVATGLELAIFQPHNAGAAHAFGNALSVSNGIAVIGDQRDSQQGSNAGAAYLFNVASGAEIVKLTGPGPDSFFGAGVAVDNEVAFIGGPATTGAPLNRQIGLYNATNGASIASIPTPGVGGDPSFGSFLAADNGVLAVGSLYDGDPVPFQGAGSVYLFDATTQAQLARIQPTDGLNPGEFGYSVAMGDGYLAAIAGLGEMPLYMFSVTPEPTSAMLAMGFAALATAASRHR
jgi:hypothetical protein